MRTLREAKIGETVKVVKLHGEGAVKRRIMDMGVTKGVDVVQWLCKALFYKLQMRRRRKNEPEYTVFTKESGIYFMPDCCNLPVPFGVGGSPFQQGYEGNQE